VLGLRPSFSAAWPLPSIFQSQASSIWRMCARWTSSNAERGASAFRAMLVYNVLIAAYLGYLDTAGHLKGVLLWPGFALHALVALLLIWRGRGKA
jgi:hypothetical protein